jgi:Putative zinc binding domain
MSPLCESFLPAERVNEMEPFYPLHVRACMSCWLVQLPSFVSPAEIFTEYAYFLGVLDRPLLRERAQRSTVEPLLYPNLIPNG